ncbi:MAG: hypothetical protein JJU40_16805 [Rhodobacteraceae bacterium]|nr:hypothetical protein [Paracoccaceae bacterium]
MVKRTAMCSLKNRSASSFTVIALRLAFRLAAGFAPLRVAATMALARLLAGEHGAQAVRRRTLLRRSPAPVGSEGSSSGPVTP